MKKVLLSMIMVILALVFAGQSNAEIKISLPKEVLGEVLAGIIQEEAGSIKGLGVDIKVDYSYAPGSLQKHKDKITIRIRNVKKILFVTAYYQSVIVELEADRSYEAITTVTDKRNIFSVNSTSEFNKEFMPLFEELIKRIYARIGNSSEK